MTAPIASGWSKIAGWDSHPLKNTAFARRTPLSVIPDAAVYVSNAAELVVHALQLVHAISGICIHSKTSSRLFSHQVIIFFPTTAPGHLAWDHLPVPPPRKSRSLAHLLRQWLNVLQKHFHPEV